MPLPLLLAVPAVAWWIGGAVVGVAAIGAVAYNWDDVKKNAIGKKIAIVGGRASGKTTLMHFLNYGTVPAEYKPTDAEKIKQNPSLAKELGLVLKDSMDISGNWQMFRAEWEGLISDADIVIYLFDIEKFIENRDQAEEQVTQELAVVEGALKKRGSNPPKTFLIATHIDKDPKFDPKKPDDYTDKILDRFLFLKGIQVKLGGSDNCQLLFGSLKDSISTEKVVKSFLQKYQSN